jgi:hypothetical protein
MHRATTIVTLLFLAGCGSAPGTGSAGSDDDWIEVPLTANTFREHPTSYRQDVLDIHVEPGRGLEIKLVMREGDAVVYSWQATGLDRADQLISEFHGHTDEVPGEKGTVMFYKKATVLSDQGSLVAPFDGIHGWYLRNDAYSPVVVQLTLAGFYELEDAP